MSPAAAAAPVDCFQITLSGFNNPSDSDSVVTVVLKDVGEGAAATALDAISFSDNDLIPFPSGPSGIVAADKPPLPAGRTAVTALSSTTGTTPA